MSGAEDSMDTKVQQAAGIVAASGNKVGIRKAMELVGFSKEEMSKPAICQRVRRKSMKAKVVDKDKKDTPLSAVMASGTATATSDLTTTSTANRNRPSSDPSTVSEAVEAEAEADAAAHSVPLETLLTAASTVKTPENKKEKKKRKSSKEAHRMNASRAMDKERNSAGMKAATRSIAQNNNLPKEQQRTVKSIAEETNQKFNSNIRPKLASLCVREGLVGVSPKKTGPVGHFSKRIYSALKGAFATFLQLEQANSSKQSSIKMLSIKVNACVNKAGFQKTRDDLTRKLKKDTAHLFEVGKANIQEQRRARWTTKYNLDIWFTAWKDFLLELGFARDKDKKDTDEGEIVFLPGQKRRIINLDEADGSIDETTGQRGGRPALVFHCPGIAGGATCVNKSGCSATVICGSNAEGEPLPPHFQLKSLAQTKEGQGLSVDWFKHTKDVLAQFGNRVRKALPVTFGMNEKAGVNATELQKCLHGSILPLFPDIEDTPQKRVIVKIDSGPGRTNVEMLAEMRLRGLCVAPGAPNTTGKTQETDQNYGPFKSGFRGNTRDLSQARFEKGLTVKVTDLAMLVFGGADPETGVHLADCFSDAFSIESNLACWKKCGAVPLTRAPLFSREVRSEVPVGPAAAANDTSFDDPQIAKLKRIENLNGFYTDILISNGFDGEQLRLKAPTRSKVVAVTAPHSRERIKALTQAKTAGQLFHATGGQHINSHEFFRAAELRNRKREIEALEQVKAKRRKTLDEQKAAVALIKKKGELTDNTHKKFSNKEIEVLLKWKGVKGETKRKADIVEAYINAPKPKITTIWKRSEEAQLQKLKDEMIPLEETALGVATTQMAKAVANNLSILDKESFKNLKEALGKMEQEEEDTTEWLDNHCSMFFVVKTLTKVTTCCCLLFAK